MNDVITSDALRELLVIDSLDVEVTRLETNRVTASYRVSANGETHETEFAYRYAESVFDPDAPADPSGLYRFGRTEWQEIEGAVAYALDHGAEQVILAGYSTGATGEMAFLAQSALASSVAAVFFDSPNLDFGRAVKVEALNSCSA